MSKEPCEQSAAEYSGRGRNPKEPLVKKILAMLVPRKDSAMFEKVKSMLSAAWGQPERISGLIPFNWTDYYADISDELDRCFLSYPGLYPVSQLSEWKLEAGRLESATGKSRRVNLDPGAIDGARLLLASTKDHAHRIYLRDGIFAEVTLCRRKGKWTSFFYTFPDFKSGVYDEWLELVRKDWKRERMHSI